MSRLPRLAFVLAFLLAPPRRGGATAASSPLAFLGRGDISTGSFLASAAHGRAGASWRLRRRPGRRPRVPETRTVAGAAAARVVSQFENHQGVMVKMVEELLVELNAAFCDAVNSTSARRVRRFRGRAPAPLDDLRGRVRVRRFRRQYGAPRHMPVQEQFELVTGATRRDGDLSVAREATTLFLAQSTLNRPDIKATVVANDAKRRETTRAHR